jgi:diaminohydroxyphosphoribosylaminopyrimidine deaminase/5-amino-6-(5-phosphoribosylamino)uracil reductase
MPSDKIDEVVGREHLEEALRRKRGVIIISAHLGNFTMLSSALAAMGFTECATIMKPTKDEETERIFSMIRERLVDKFMIFKAFKILGAGDGMPMATGKGPTCMDDTLKLERTKIRKIGDDILITGYPVYQGKKACSPVL